MKDFLDDFIDKALKLEIVGDVREASVSARQVEIQEFDGSDTRPNLKVSVPSKTKEREEKVKEDFRKKIKEIGDNPNNEDDLNYYRLLTVRVTYPFWKRPYVLKEWKDGEFKRRKENGGTTEYAGNPIEVEKMISEWYLNTYVGNKGEKLNQVNREDEDDDGKEKNNGEGGGDGGGGKDVEVLVEIPKKKRARMDEESFSPFNVDIFVKISTKLVDVHTRKLEDALKTLERPYVSLVLQVIYTIVDKHKRMPAYFSYVNCLLIFFDNF